MENYKLPYYVDFSITSFCNLKCKFCSASAPKNSSNIKTLSLNEISKIFDEFDNNGILRVAIEGGEPFLRDDIIEILKLADTHMFSYFINTNATLLTEDIIKELSKTNLDKLCISVDGPNKKIHEHSRGVQGSFEKTINAIKSCLKHGVNVDGILTLNKANKNHIIETLHFLKSIGIENVAIMLLASVGDAAKNLNDVYLSFEEWTNILIDLTYLKKENKLPVNLRLVPTGESKCPWELFLPLKFKNMENFLNLWVDNNAMSTLNENDFGCTAGKDNLAVDANGNVFGCSLMVSEKDLIAGNIKNNSLYDIWNKSKIFKQLRKSKLENISGKCKSCDLLMKCKGGCRACAFSLTKNLLGSDLRCPIKED